MFRWFIVAGITYLCYNISRDDLMHYCEMKMNGYMGIYSYDEDDTDETSTRGCDDSVIIHTGTEPIDNDLSVLSVSMLDTFRENFLERMGGCYFEMLAAYYDFKNKCMSYSFVFYMNMCISYVWNKWKRFSCPYLLEPEENEWVDNVSLYRVKGESGKFVYSINDSYMFHMMGDSTNQNGVNKIKEQMSIYAKRNQLNKCNLADIPVGVIEVIDHLIIGKCLDKDNKPMYNTSENACIGKKSNASFMSVEYIHPLMDTNSSICLNIPHEMYIANNVLFTPTHVLRLLKHQPLPFYFDMDYELKIVDGMVNIFSITSNDCILLTENGYSVEKHSMEKKTIRQ